MNTLLQNPLTWAAIAAACYGFCTPLQKSAIQHGTGSNGVTLLYGIMLIVVGSMKGFHGMFTTPKGFLPAFIFAILGSIGIRSVSQAFTLVGANVSTVALIIGSFPIISSLIGLTVLKETNNLVLWRFLLGACFALIGLYFVITSSRTP
jgi:drug/metabolite transporter (DMT)-like permease